MKLTLVNGRWPVLLPDHRAARVEWPWHEAARFAAMHHALAPMDAPVLWDVGAELGDHAAVYASWGCRLVLVEPNPQAWPCIAATLEANDATGAVVGWCWAFAGRPDPDLAVVAADRMGLGVPPWPLAAVGVCDERAGMAHLSGRPDPDPYDNQPTTTLDALLAAGFPPPDAVTIDVEGAELFTLQGAQGMLAEHRPLLWVSIHPDLMAGYGTHPDQVHTLLGDAGYDGVLLAVDHEEHWQWVPR